jgi:hypothetical protein
VINDGCPSACPHRRIVVPAGLASGVLMLFLTLKADTGHPPIAFRGACIGCEQSPAALAGLPARTSKAPRSVIATMPRVDQ